VPTDGPRPPAHPPLELGVITKPHGLRGEVHVRPYNVDSRVLDDVDEVLVRRRDEHGEPAAQPLKLVIENVRPTPDGSWLVAFAGVVTRNDAETLRGAVVSVRRGDLPKLEDGELYAEDLPGLEAFAPDGTSLGRVRDVYSNGAQEVLVVATAKGDIEVPFVEAHVGEVDVAARRIVILDIDALVPGP
jgi:16S rRNA processing protein RimM